MEEVFSIEFARYRQYLESYLGIVKVKDDGTHSRNDEEDEVVFPPNGRKSSRRNLQEDDGRNKEP